MPIITMPSTLGLARLKWSAPPTYQLNRSEFTGFTRMVEIGPAERWFATGEVVPDTLADIISVRAFIANMKRPNNFVRLRMTEAGQTTGGWPTSATVNGAGQLGLTLSLAGLRPSQTNLLAGHIISVVLATEESQPIVLGADLVANGSGIGTATLTTPLRRSPANGAVVELQFPTCTMRMRDPLAWEANPGGVYGGVPFVAEEAF